MALQGETITGVFPVTVMRLPLLGSKVIAMAYQMYSGLPLTANADTRLALVRAAVEQAKAEGAKYVEIRHHDVAPELLTLGFVHVDSGLVTTQIPLDGLELTQAEHGHRQRVRKAAKQGVEIVEATTLEELRAFRRAYLETGRAMSAPQAGWPFFQALHDLARDTWRLYLARHEGRTVGGLLVMGDDHVTFARCSAHSTSEALKLNAGPALWWRALTDAAERGCTGFNCGITWVADAGLIKWKEGWGGPSLPVHTYVLPLRTKPPEAGGYFEGYGLAKGVWKRLPLRVVDAVGHAVTRWIG